METINVQVNTKINATIEKVFEAIVEPKHLNNYFASQSTGPLTQGETIIWNFEDAGVQCEVHVQKIVMNTTIHFEWNAIGKIASKVQMEFEDLGDGKTLLKISEIPFLFTPEDVKKALGQTQGWTDFVCSLKAYLYTGINLRSGQTKC